jgi:hypothetical protein
MGEKKVNGRKRQCWVDTNGFLLRVLVHPADIVITANRNCKEINPGIMHKIVLSFDYAFIEFVPQLKKWAHEHELRFEGKISKLIEEGFQNRLEG